MFRKPTGTEASVPSASEEEGIELTDEELEHVVGGLQRQWTAAPTSAGLAPEPIPAEAALGAPSAV